MAKKIIYFLFIFTLATIGMAPVFAGQNAGDAGRTVILPEQAGIYDVPGRPDMKLRVFVHEGNPIPGGKFVKPVKPSPVTPPELICGPAAEADPNSDSVVNGAGWKLPSSWEYRINTSSVPASVSKSNIAAIANNSFAEWLGAIDNSVAITAGIETTKSKAQFDGQNIIAWGRAPATALAVTYIWYNPETGIASEIDTIMNAKFTWYWSDPSQWPEGEVCAYSGVYDAQNILTHELGHTMGLDDVYTDEYINNTMYGYGSVTETKKDTLTNGDGIGVFALY